MSGARISLGFKRDPASPVAVKICGLKEPEHAVTAVDAGAAYLGFNFVERSPRYVTPERARDIADALASASDRVVGLVGLFADPSDAAIDAALEHAPLTFIQLHGHEPVERVVAVKERLGLPVIKAVSIASRDDLEALDRYGDVADILLVDAKPPPETGLTGGGGVAFDWRLIADRAWRRPWMLAGGLTQQNVADAIRITGAPAVDLSSGVESSRGVKDPQKICAFLEAVSAA